MREWRVSNIGNATAGSIRNGFYLSRNSTITPGDTLLDSNHNSPIIAGGGFNWDGPRLRIPAGTPPGSYWIGILVDDQRAVPESNEFNNYVSYPFTVR